MQLVRWLMAACAAALIAACGSGDGRGGDEGPATDTAPTVAVQPADAEIEAGQTATFTVQALGSGPLSYQWFKGGASITGADAAAYTTLPLTHLDDGSYFTVQVSNRFGSVTSAPARLTVNAAPVAVAHGRLSANLLSRAAVTDSGRVLMFGDPSIYNLFGDGTPMAGTEATALELQAQAVSAGTSSTLAVGRDGKVYGWGTNVNGELGDGRTYEAMLTPRALVGLEAAVAVVAGDAFSYALKGDGTVWHLPGTYRMTLSGYTSSARQVAGLGDVVALVPMAGNFSPVLAIKADGTVWKLSWTQQVDHASFTYTYTVTPTQVTGVSEVRSAACGSNHCLFALQDGRVVARGANGSGQLGDGTRTASTASLVQPLGLPRIASVAAQGSRSVALAEDGSLWIWGWVEHGVPERLTPEMLPGVTDVVEIAPNWAVMFRRRDGSLWTWGAADAPVRAAGVDLRE